VIDLTPILTRQAASLRARRSQLPAGRYALDPRCPLRRAAIAEVWKNLPARNRCRFDVRIISGFRSAPLGKAFPRQFAIARINQAEYLGMADKMIQRAETIVPGFAMCFGVGAEV